MTNTVRTWGVWAPYTHSCRILFPSSLPGPKLAWAMADASLWVTIWHGSIVLSPPCGAPFEEDCWTGEGESDVGADVAAEVCRDLGLGSAAGLSLLPQAV